MRILLIISMAVMLFAGCSIKEDRDECPCRLWLDLSEVDTMVVKSLNFLAFGDGELVFEDTVYVSDFSKIYQRDVPRGIMWINAAAGGGDWIDERGVEIPYGCECPPIYMNSFAVDARGEVCHEKVCVNKNHCRLTVKMEGMSIMPYSLTFRGKIDGYGADGKPSSGDFYCVAYPTESGESYALLPRQTDSSLLLDVDDGTAEAKTFALGEHIVSCGYDWTAKDLADVTVVLDYYLTYIKIKIQGWDKEYVYNITL